MAWYFSRARHDIALALEDMAGRDGGGWCRSLVHGRVQQHGIEFFFRLPVHYIAADNFRFKLQSFKIFLQAFEPSNRPVKSGDLGARGGHLRGLAAGSCRKIGDPFAFNVAKQLNGQRGGGVLHPPGAILKTFDVSMRPLCFKRIEPVGSNAPPAFCPDSGSSRTLRSSWA